MRTKKYLTKLLVFIILSLNTLSEESLMTCETPGRGYFKFTSKTVGRAIPSKSIRIQGRCFEEIKIITTKNETHFLIDFESKTSIELGCVEFILISSGIHTNAQMMIFEGKFQKSFEIIKMSQNEINFIEEEGFFVLRSCDDLKYLPYNIFLTVKLFIGGWMKSQFIPIFGSRIPEFQLLANIDFVKKTTGFEWQFRKETKKILIDRKYIRSGDFFGSARFDGLANFSHLISGSRIGHCAMALWHENELYVIETEQGGHDGINGVKKTTYEQFLKKADMEDANIILLPLNESARERFDEKKAWEAFLEMEGSLYGLSNFIFSGQDTENDNRPDWIDYVYLGIVIGWIDQYLPESMSLMILDAWNKRLGTENLSMDSIWEELYKRKMSLGKLSAIPEKDDWEYKGIKGRSLVCSSLVVYLYKAAGLFGNLEINATEFTPKDIVNLNFWDLSLGHLPKACQNFSRGYCQLMGKIDLDVGPINFVEPYNHMDETCATVPPKYERKPGC